MPGNTRVTASALRFGAGVGSLERGTETLDQRVYERESRSETETACQPTLPDDTRFRLGTALRSIYEEICDTQPIPDSQIDLLLRLRHKERDRRRMD
jgi:hypothetical protein